MSIEWKSLYHYANRICLFLCQQKDNLHRNANRMGVCIFYASRIKKARDLFKKIRDTKGIFHAKMDTIKDRNGIDLIKSEDIKKRWQEYTELYKRSS